LHHDTTSTSTPAMSHLSRTQQTFHPEEYTVAKCISFPPSAFPHNINTSSSIMMHLKGKLKSVLWPETPCHVRNRSQQLSKALARVFLPPTKRTSYSHTTPPLSRHSTHIRARNAPLPKPATVPTPLRYLASLTPQPSPLRPHAASICRLREWRPTHSSPNQVSQEGVLVDLGHNRVKDLKELAWDKSTRATYGAGLLAFHVFCDSKSVSESDQAPVSRQVLENFIATLAGSYSSSAINNYVCGIRAWHLLHRLEWNHNKAEMDLLIRGAQKAAPKSSTREKRDPFTIDYIIAIRSQLNLNLPLDAAVFACLTTAFYATARLGELTVKSLGAFDPAQHVKITDV
jgi:hypothetical protein